MEPTADPQIPEQGAAPASAEQPKPKSKGGRPKGSKSRKTLERELAKAKAQIAAAKGQPADPFAEPVREVKQAPESEQPAAAEGAPAGEAQSAAVTLGEDGARMLLKTIFDTFDSTSPLLAWMVLKRQLGEAQAQKVFAEAQKVVQLRPDERAELELVLVARLAQMEMSPDTMIWVACGKVLYRMGSGLLTVVETGRAPVEPPPTIPATATPIAEQVAA